MQNFIIFFLNIYFFLHYDLFQEFLLIPDLSSSGSDKDTSIEPLKFTSGLQGAATEVITTMILFNGWIG